MARLTPKVIGIAGGSGSGKTTFARLITETLGHDKVSLLEQDNYYIDQSHKFDRDGGSVNFDHPEAIDWKLFSEHLQLLKKGEGISRPTYDFSSHKRKKEIVPIEPRPFILLDGILIHVPEIVHMHIDFKIFIQASEEIRFSRRLKRDVTERGRTEEGVRAQYFLQVKPMHDMFVEPSMNIADQVISGEIDFTTIIEAVVKKLT
ncbi:MAG: uridine kinase [Bdellovibrionales bacterium RBG_16_40_8]|nr:MAG: uridine kinase [Bdellovibrionales bacterium RBG_16_40_8]